MAISIGGVKRLRVIICVDHNQLMEPKNELSSYAICDSCPKHDHRSPNWFPVRLAFIKHRDKAMKRTWVWELTHYSISGGKWTRRSEVK